MKKNRPFLAGGRCFLVILLLVAAFSLLVHPALNTRMGSLSRGGVGEAPGYAHPGERAFPGGGNSAGAGIGDRLGPASASASPSADRVETGDRAREIGTALVTARNRLSDRAGSRGTENFRTIRADGRNDALVPEHVPLLPGQQRALAELRMRSGKQVTVRARPLHRTLRYLEGTRLEPASGEGAEATAARFLENNGRLLRIDNPATELVETGRESDSLGFTRIRYRQQYRGLPVWPSSVMVQTEPGGDVVLLTGSYIPTPDHVDPEPAVPLDAAVEQARRVVSASPETPCDAELVIYAPAEEKARLSWHLIVRSSLAETWRVLVDARDGTVLEHYNTVRSNRVTASDADLLGVVREFSVWQESDYYWMTDTSKGMFDPQSDPPKLDDTRGGIIVFNCQGQETLEQAMQNEAILYAGSENLNSGFEPSCVSLSYHLSLFHDMLEDRFDRSSWNNQGGTVYGFTNLTFANALCSGDGRFVAFGDVGTGPLSGEIDIVGHESGHAVNHFTAGFVYQFQSGAIDEALADIFGESLQAFQAGTVPDYANLFRSLRDPNSIPALDNQPHPASMSEYFVLDLQTDNGGVHINSTIVSHSFWLLAEGLAAGGIGFDEAQKIYYRAIAKLNRNSQFIDMRLACIQSAEELFGNGSEQARKTAEAFNVVEIYEQPGSPDPVPIPTVSGADSLLFTFVSWLDGYTYLARREEAQGDGAEGMAYDTWPLAAGKIPSVTGDGSAALFVTADFDIALLDTLTGEYEKLGYPGSVYSASLSADGSVASFVFLNEYLEPENRINVLDLQSGEMETFALKAAVLDSDATDTILFADKLDMTPDGKAVLYDALNRITFSDGTYTESWSIYELDIATGNIITIIPPIEDLHVGNPSFASTAGHIVTFEVQDYPNELRSAYIMNLATGDLAKIAESEISAGLMYPGFNGDDSKLVLTAYEWDEFYWKWVPYVAEIPLQNDFTGAAGPPVNLVMGTTGVVYRRGEYSGLPVVEVDRSTAAVNEGEGTAAFTISRTGHLGTALPVTFLVSGTAANGVDYGQIDFTSSIPVDAASLTIELVPIDDLLPEPAETVTLALAETTHYTIGPQRSATITIIDNDGEVVGEPVEIVSFAIEADGLHCSFIGDPGEGNTFCIEVSGNLEIWEFLCNPAFAGEIGTFVDPDFAAAGHRFYRIVRSPVQ